MGSSRRILGALGLLSCLALFVPVPAALAATAAPGVPAPGEQARVPFAERYRAVRMVHGEVDEDPDTVIGHRVGAGSDAYRNDVMNSAIAEFGHHSFVRQPEHMNNLGYDADVFDLSPALSGGARSLSLRFTGESQGHFLGVLFVQTDARR